MSEKRPIGWVALLPALTVPLLASLVYFVWLPESPVGQAAYTGVKVFLLVYPLFFLRRIGLAGLTRREDSGRCFPSWGRVLLTGFASGAAIAVAGFLLMLTPLGETIRGGAAQVEDRAEDLGFKEHFLLFAIFISVIHSALEEYYWRWFVYGHLRKKVGRWAGHLIAALGFAAHHIVITLQFFPPLMALFLGLCVAVGGLIWTLLYERDGTVVGCWVSHLVVDVFLMIIGYQLILAGS